MIGPQNEYGLFEGISKPMLTMNVRQKADEQHCRIIISAYGNDYIRSTQTYTDRCCGNRHWRNQPWKNQRGGHDKLERGRITAGGCHCLFDLWQNLLERGGASFPKPFKHHHFAGDDADTRSAEAV